ncbi:helix-turn-helix domain-containing protein [Botrimarina sp.]|uniref:helix-turn-helix domain-containing protein n=1 Tax=Botrimarina sp. TaxID=2795802 RepID=UPI0032EEC5AC
MLARVKPAQSQSDSEVLTLHEAARLLRVSERTAWKLAKAGRLPGSQLGNQWRFLRSELLEAVASPDAE